MTDKLELTNTMANWSFQQAVEVDGRQATDLERYALRWYVGPEGCLPVLYFDGKRVTKKWRVVLAVEAEEDTKGANANTA